ncbi:glutamine amidotransferase-like class 1 domain-containing protein 3A, mitochondrial [Xenopus tropicalis]|uniref:Glutamine amidotransferase-like class 1 domain-containing protein 3A, mitochondrial n=1 Tax=Xenopus tropicalis TaxID=8364 RepID=A0A8J0T5N9_XENTR|nr:glutamine amidotransferase-like class 1 domain-containing protein 3A, mitochondrial [Xenopus tropicalis]|eukprot:XP_017952314.1 PREDICTED: ES1 protein homolog, mitochondrial-like [Xenopus tropicalis]
MGAASTHVPGRTTLRWPYAGTAAAIKELGCKHVNKQVSEVHVDAKNKLVTTSAFMCNSPVYDMYDGTGEMVLTLTNY